MSFPWQCLLSFLIQVEIFLAFGMQRFWLNPKHFGYYVTRLWLLFKFSALAGLSWHSSGGGKGTALLLPDRKRWCDHHCWTHGLLASHCPPLKSLPRRGRNTLLLLLTDTRGMVVLLPLISDSPDFPLGPLWHHPGEKLEGCLLIPW